MSQNLNRRPGPAPSFTEGDVHKHLIRLTGYMFMGFSAMTISQLIEAIYLGILGTEPLAAVSFTFPVVMLLQSVAMGLGVGASSVIARTMGTGDRQGARKLVSHCLIMVTGLIVSLAFLGRMMSRPIFVMLGAEDEILNLTVMYINIWFLGLPLFALSMIGTSLIRAVGNAAMPGIVMTLGSILQVLISPLLIFGIGPFPEMGLEGAAWSFVIARSCSFLLCYYCVIFQEKLITRSLDGILDSWQRILHVGLPATATNLIMPVSMGIITRLLANHGPEVVAGFGVASRVDSIMVMIVFAVASSAGPFIGQNWGAGKFDRVDKALSLCNRFSLVWGLIAFIFMLLFGEFLVSLINQDPLVVESATWYLLIIPLSIGFMGIISIASSCFNAMGEPIPPLIISVCRMLIVYVPMALVLDHFFGYVGIFIATSVSTILMGALAWYWNRSALRKARAQRESA